MSKPSGQKIDSLHVEMDAPGTLRLDRTPRAIELLDGIRKLIDVLETKGAAISVEAGVNANQMQAKQREKKP